MQKQIEPINFAYCGEVIDTDAGYDAERLLLASLIYLLSVVWHTGVEVEKTFLHRFMIHGLLVLYGQLCTDYTLPR